MRITKAVLVTLVLAGLAVSGCGQQTDKPPTEGENRRAEHDEQQPERDTQQKDKQEADIQFRLVLCQVLILG